MESWHFAHGGMGFIAWSFVFFEVSETALGRKKWYPYLRESAFRDLSRHSFISRLKGSWGSDCCKSCWEVWRDEHPVHGSDFMRISISFFLLGCTCAWCAFFFFKYMYWWTYSQTCGSRNPSPSVCFLLCFLFSLSLSISVVVFMPFCTPVSCSSITWLIIVACLTWPNHEATSLSIPKSGYLFLFSI